MPREWLFHSLIFTSLDSEAIRFGANVDIVSQINEAFSENPGEVDNDFTYTELQATCKNLFNIASGDSDALNFLRSSLQNIQTNLISLRTKQLSKHSDDRPVGSLVSFLPETENRCKSVRIKGSNEK